MSPPAATLGADDGYELAQHTPSLGRSAKGNEREKDDEDRADETLDDSDDEVEQLLTSTGDAVLPRIDATEDGTTDAGRGMGRRGSAGAGDPRKGSSKVLNVLFGGMTPNQRRVFLREMIVETLPVLLFALAGAILAGELLQRLQSWRVFIRIEELFILVPILLNLKGNLEMNLAARFSTSANIGELDLRLTRRSLVLGNLALLQVQALLVSFVSGLLAFILGMASRKGVHHALQHPIYKPGMVPGTAAGGADVTEALRGGYFEALLVLCVSMLAAGFSSGICGSFMCSTVIMCRRFRVNPDNIATPLAAALGDLVTLVILGVLSSLFILFMGTIVSSLVFLALLGAIAANIVFVFRNAYVQELLTMGWGPLFAAMAISSATGVILETYVNRYPGFALLGQVMTAISGASGSIFVSRISTALHTGRREHYSFTAAMLIVVTYPILLAFFGFVWATGQADVSAGFFPAYAVATAIQLVLTMLVAHQGSLLLWKLDYDPDVYALPLFSAAMDVSGQLLLVAAYAFSGTKTLETAVDDSQAGEVAADGVVAVVEALRRRWTG
ncbi:magnesium transporter [Rhodotorula toruloides]|uniref:BY PROTMAP: gi/472587891/gb/EMS25387.1/ magnesium transporter [Rhodosporidium toruloides NP11] gi/647401605/emb/CDR47967.1/ RHTO0S15e04302g1_1 [Rhodosporidium toruloides] n=1 Tax=Rhodotorula toruloides TaxID=5286 RepID=A0A0K3CHY9_RHOTO|nr:magnesium transporter [Rhodotorula toruloides]